MTFKRLVHGTGPAGTDVIGEGKGAVIGVASWPGGCEYNIRLDDGSQVAIDNTDVTPVVPLPLRLIHDSRAQHAAARWIARSRGQSHVLEASDPWSTARKVIMDAARDLVAEIDVAVCRPDLCRFTWTEPARPGSFGTTAIGDTIVDVFACKFAQEPGHLVCGVHLPYLTDNGWACDWPSEQASDVVSPIGWHDPAGVLAR